MLPKARVFFGVPLKSIPGATLDGQQEVFGKMSQADFTELANVDGFHAVVKAGTGIIIPGSYAYVLVNSSTEQKCVGLKWPVVINKVRAVEAKSFLDEYVSEHEASSSDTIAQVSEYLGTVE